MRLSLYWLPFTVYVPIAVCTLYVLLVLSAPACLCAAVSLPASCCTDLRGYDALQVISGQQKHRPTHVLGAKDAEEEAASVDATDAENNAGRNAAENIGEPVASNATLKRS